MRVRLLHLIAGLTLASCAGAACAARPDTVLYSFKGGPEGAFPAVGLTPDGHGGFFGMTLPFAGDSGAAWDLSPPGARGQPWSLSLLTVFHGQEDGAGAAGTLLPDGHGGLYGVTGLGGKHQAGSVFELSPPARAGDLWTRTTLYSFRGRPDDGAFPTGGLVADAAGDLYGATENGGDGPCPEGCGAVFKLTPPKPGQSAWTETLLHDFHAYPDGAFPVGALIIDGAGNLYGTAAGGGRADQCDEGCGTIFRLGPTDGGANWDFTILKALTTDLGGQPFGALALDAAGNLYGTASTYGRTVRGTVFELSPPAAGDKRWTPRLLHLFTLADGSRPQAGLVIDAAGALYGTAEDNGRDGLGVVFRLQPPAVPGGRWIRTVLHAFRYHHDGATPVAPVIFGPGGLLFGTTYQGGKHNLGTVFELVP